VLVGRIWRDLLERRFPAISLALEGRTFAAASRAASARTSHIWAKCAGSLDAFSVYMASKSHRNEGR
jgi:hypothetical protein